VIDDALTDLTNPAKNPKQYPLPRDILLLAIDAFERPTDPEDPCQPTQTAPADKSAEVAHGVIYNLASPLHAVMNVRGTGQKSFARRLLRMFQARWAWQGVNIATLKFFSKWKIQLIGKSTSRLVRKRRLWLVKSRLVDSILD